jgi:predicted DNA-binding antitoxin AbrB/MazE fold protein
MSKVLQATYQDGKLALDEKLDAALEGKKLRIIVLEALEAGDQGEQILEPRKQRFLEQLQQHSFTLPENYQFDREELYGR